MHWVMMLGVATGMRTFTGMAVLCWAVLLGFLPEAGWAWWVGSMAAVILFTLLALGEYVGDVLPQTPSRKAPALVAGRLFFGAMVGALAWRAIGEPIVGGVILGVIGALIGTYGGYRVRMAVARWMGRDWPAGVCESASALGLAIWGAHSLHLALIRPPVAMLVAAHLRMWA